MRTTGLHHHKPFLVLVATTLLLVAANVNAQSPPNATVAQRGGNTTVPPFVVRTWNVSELPCLGVNASIVNVTFAGVNWAQALVAGSGAIANLCVDLTQDIATAVFGWDANCTGGALKVVALTAVNNTNATRASDASAGGLRVSIHVSRLLNVNESLWRANAARLPLLEAWYERMKPARQSRNRTDHSLTSPPLPTSKSDRGGGHGGREKDRDDDDDDDDGEGTEHQHVHPPQVFVLAMSVVDSNGHAGVYFRSGSLPPITTTAAPETPTTVVVVVSPAADNSMLILIVAASLVVVVLGVLVGVVCWVVRRDPDGTKRAVVLDDGGTREDQPPSPSAGGQQAAAPSHQVQVTLNVEAVMLARAAQRETPPVKRPRPTPAVLPPPPMEEDDFTQLASAAPAPRTSTTPSRRRVVVIDVPTNVLVAPPAALQPAAAEADE